MITVRIECLFATLSDFLRLLVVLSKLLQLFLLLLNKQLLLFKLVVSILNVLVLLFIVIEYLVVMVVDPIGFFDLFFFETSTGEIGDRISLSILWIPLVFVVNKFLLLSVYDFLLFRLKELPLTLLGSLSVCYGLPKTDVILADGSISTLKHVHTIIVHNYI